MMKKLAIFLTILSLLIVSSSDGSEVNKRQASLVANNFFFERNHQINSLLYGDNVVNQVVEVMVNKSQIAYYIITYKSCGWIIVSGSLKTRPIIAYSFTGNYNNDLGADNFNAWMLQYKIQIKEVIDSNAEANSEVLGLWDHYLSSDSANFTRFRAGRSVEPLIVTSWDQGIYYNEMCPSDAGGPGGHCLTGCVPTCMGQIANYFRFPQTGVGSYSYDGGPYDTLTANFGESYYNWNEMPSRVSTNSLATAQLLFHFGVSCDLVYGPDGSGMYNHKAAYALRTYFKYSPDTEYLYRDSTNLNWDSVIIAHLDQKIPMYYAGWSVPNLYGHAFVCDGYQEGQYFHFNWGWSGSNDGYFYTGNLNPGGNNFNLAQELIINCFPDTVNYTYPLYCTGADTLESKAGTIDDGSGPIYDYVENQNCSWLISPADSVESITLTFYGFDVHITDTLTIYDGSSDDSNIIGSYSGNMIPDDITSSGDELFIRFSSDDQNNGSGWLLGYSCEIPNFCSNNVITDSEGHISDGSGPANYQNLTTCIWMIQPPDVEKIVLNFTEFDIEEDHDFVTIYDGSDKIGEFSGNELPGELMATSGMMTLVFSTNSSIVDLGWSAYFTSETVGANAHEIDSDINIYPNPSDDLIHIINNGIVTINDVRVFDLFGVEYQISRSIISGGFALNTSSLSDGMYICEISNGSKVTTKKIIIKH